MNNICNITAKFIGDTARPMSILMLAAGIVGGAFFHVDVAALTVEAGAFAGLVAARAVENHTQIKADAEVKKAETAAASSTTAGP